MSRSEFSALLDRVVPLARTISTDQEAAAAVSALLFDHSRQGPTFLGKKHRRKQATMISDDLVQPGIQFTQEIVVVHWASQLLNLLEQRSFSAIQSFHDQQKAPLSWVRLSQAQPVFNKVLSLTETLLKLDAQPKPRLKNWKGYGEFTQHILDEYPDWTGSESAWVNLAEQEGAEAILARLASLSKNETSLQEIPLSEKNEVRDAFVGRFVQQQILPLVTAHLKTSLVALQHESEWRARETWHHIQEGITRQKEQQNLIRLCGTWQWLIHNHQNHGDHKTVMVYPPPSQYDRMDPKPAKVQVQGDTVYIRWEFPNGIIQEESLLFSDKDRMLSGTFVNNMGPNGNISGRRIAPCQNR